MYANLKDAGVKITEIDRKPFEDATADYRNKYVKENNLQELVDKINSYK